MKNNKDATLEKAKTVFQIHIYMAFSSFYSCFVFSRNLTPPPPKKQINKYTKANFTLIATTRNTCSANQTRWGKKSRFVMKQKWKNSLIFNHQVLWEWKNTNSKIQRNKQEKADLSFPFHLLWSSLPPPPLVRRPQLACHRVFNRTCWWMTPLLYPGVLCHLQLHTGSAVAAWGCCCIVWCWMKLRCYKRKSKQTNKQTSKLSPAEIRLPCDKTDSLIAARPPGR